MTPGATGAPGADEVDLPGAGVRLRATRRHGDGTPLLLLHGLASTRHVWDLVLPGLEGLPVLAPDQRGHGDSDRPATGYGYEEVVADAVALLDAAGVDRAVVVGHSWGAWTALALAAAHPDRVLAVVAVDGGLARPTGDPDELREALAPPRIALPREELTAMVRAGSMATWWSPAVEAAVLSVFAEGEDGLYRARFPREAHLQVVEALITGDPHAVLDRVGCPVWAVVCEPVGPAEETAWGAARAEGLAQAAARLARPRLLRWGGAVHDVPLQWPDLVVGLIRSAVAEVAAPTAGRAQR